MINCPISITAQWSLVVAIYLMINTNTFLPVANAEALNNIEKKILGTWEKSSFLVLYNYTYHEDNTWSFKANLGPEKQGTWQLKGNILTRITPSENKTDTFIIEDIGQHSKTIISTTGDKKSYRFRRIHPTGYTVVIDDDKNFLGNSYPLDPHKKLSLHQALSLAEINIEERSPQVTIVNYHQSNSGTFQPYNLNLKDESLAHKIFVKPKDYLYVSLLPESKEPPLDHSEELKLLEEQIKETNNKLRNNQKRLNDYIRDRENLHSLYTRDADGIILKPIKSQKNLYLAQTDITINSYSTHQKRNDYIIKYHKNYLKSERFLNLLLKRSNLQSLNWTKNKKNHEKLIKKMLNIDSNNMTLTLSLKHTSENETKKILDIIVSAMIEEKISERKKDLVNQINSTLRFIKAHERKLAIYQIQKDQLLNK